MIRVMISGASGRMGQEVAKAVLAADDLELVGAMDPFGKGQDIGALVGAGANGIQIANNLSDEIARSKPEIVIDFTVPSAVYNNVLTYLEHGVFPVVGTTGMNLEAVNDLIDRSEKAGVGGLIAPNFALGAVLMMRFAAEAARFFPNVEVIELHHDQKVDAPSGTAKTTVEMILEQRDDFQQGPLNETENISGVRGGKLAGGVRIHSIRLPGLVAHQEVLFGGLGQTLSIRHDTISRESFIPGVILAARKVKGLKKIIYGLDKLLFNN